MPDEDSIDEDELKFTPWDLRVISAIGVAESARKGVLMLRVLAAVVAAFSVVGSAVFYFLRDESDGPAPAIDRQTVGSFLATIAVPLAFAGLVFALSYIVQISAARLDVDIVLSDEDEADTDSKG